MTTLMTRTAPSVRQRPQRLSLGPDNNGLRLTPREFDRADFDPAYSYELVNGVCIVAPPTDVNERQPNDELSYALRAYQRGPHGHHLDETLPEHTIETHADRRRADRVIWCGLGRPPKRGELPTIAIEFVSKGRRNWVRDFETKRDEYLEVGIREYWIVDRFDRSLTVWIKTAAGRRKKVLREGQTYRTELLPGFELSISELIASATRWDDQ